MRADNIRCPPPLFEECLSSSPIMGVFLKDYGTVTKFIQSCIKVIGSVRQ